LTARGDLGFSGAWPSAVVIGEGGMGKSTRTVRRVRVGLAISLSGCPPPDAAGELHPLENARSAGRSDGQVCHGRR
jgi:hypothetical protein